MGIELTDNKERNCLFLNVYLPVESNNTYDSFMHYLGKISYNFIYALGDYNAHTDCCKNRKFGNELLTFCSDEGLVLSDVNFLGKTIIRATPLPL